MRPDRGHVPPNCGSRGDIRCCADRRRGAYLMVGREKGQRGGGRSSREIIAAFERETGKPVDPEQPSQSDIEAKAIAAVVRYIGS